MTGKLTIRPTKIGGEIIPDDYTVRDDGYGCGRIRRGFRAGAKPIWLWFINPPLPVKREGQADSLPAAKEQFKAAWAVIRPTLTPESVKHWHEVEDCVRERFG